MQPTTLTLTITLGDGVDIAGVLMALASAGIDVPRPEATEPAPAPVVELAPYIGALEPAEQLPLPLRDPIHHQHPVRRDYQPEHPAVAWWAGSADGQRLAALCRKWRKGVGSTLAVLDRLASRNGTLAYTFNDYHDFAGWAGVTEAIASASLSLLAAVDAITLERGTGHYRVQVRRHVLNG